MGNEICLIVSSTLHCTDIYNEENVKDILVIQLIFRARMKQNFKKEIMRIIDLFFVGQC